MHGVRLGQEDFIRLEIHKDMQNKKMKKKEAKCNEEDRKGQGVSVKVMILVCTWCSFHGSIHSTIVGEDRGLIESPSPDIALQSTVGLRN